MDDRDAMPTIEERLGVLDWRRGLTKADLAGRLAIGDPFAALVERHLPEGPFFSPRDLLRSLPHEVREEALTLAGGGSLAPTATAAGSDSPRVLGDDASVDISPVAGAADGDADADGVADATSGVRGLDGSPLGSSVGRPAAGATAAVATAAERAKGWAASAQGAVGGAALPDRVRQTAAQARDQVLSIRTRPSDAPAVSPDGAAPRSRSAVASVSAALDRIDRAVARQPRRVTSWGTLGLTLVLIAGLDPWLARRGRSGGQTAAGGGVGRLRPWLLLAWVLAVAVNVWDVSRGGRAANDTVVEAGGWRGLDPAGPAPSATAASAATDEYPTVGPA